MSRARKRLLLAAISVGAVVAGALASFAPEAHAEYYPGIICMDKIRTRFFSSAGEMYENAALTDFSEVQCPIPLDRTMQIINFNFSIGVKSTGTTTCRGRAYNRNGSEVWVSSQTSHSGASGYQDLSPGDGPPGTLDYNYNVTCNMAPGHLIRRIQLE